jgi:hypothetical protein
VSNRHAEAQRAHPPGVGDLVAQLPQHLGCPRVVAGVEPVKALDVVGPALPLHPGQVHIVSHAEVMERHQQVGGQRVPERQLVRRPVAEERPHVHAVGALRRGRQAEKFLRPQVVEQPPVGRRLCVVELVDHDHVEVVGR